MVSICKYRSPLGDLLLAADEEGLTGLWFVGQKYYANGLPDESIWQETKILTETRRWLEIYLTGEIYIQPAPGLCENRRLLP